MTETETLRFETDTIKKIIIRHYKEYFKDENLQIKYDVVEEDDYNPGRVIITIIRNIKIGEYIVESKNVLSYEDVLEVINTELSKYNYKAKNINYLISSNTWNGVSTLLEKINIKKKVLRKE